MHLARGGPVILNRDRLSKLAEDVLSNPRFAATLATAFQKGLSTKKALDRNVQMLLGLLNLPSRADVNRLLTKLEVIQGSLVNLHAKVDRLVPDAKPPRKARRKPSAKASR